MTPPLDAAAYCKLARSKRANSDWPGAIADFSRAIELQPDLAEAYAGRGTAKNASGDADGALADLQKALELDPKHPSLREVIRIIKKKRAKAGSKEAPSA